MDTQGRNTIAKVAMVLVVVSLTAFSDGSAAPQNRLKVVASLTPYQSIATEITGTTSQDTSTFIGLVTGIIDGWHGTQR